ncbi:unnamed protein product [Calypogeia fissa]
MARRRVFTRARGSQPGTSRLPCFPARFGVCLVVAIAGGQGPGRNMSPGRADGNHGPRLSAPRKPRGKSGATWRSFEGDEEEMGERSGRV